jgi:hypothetical protein
VSRATTSPRPPDRLPDAGLIAGEIKRRARDVSRLDQAEQMRVGKPGQRGVSRNQSLDTFGHPSMRPKRGWNSARDLVSGLGDDPVRNRKSGRHAQGLVDDAEPPGRRLFGRELKRADD